MKNKDFSSLLTSFFSDYLPNHKNVSKNTISLYRDCFVLFIKFCDEYKKIDVNKIAFSNLSNSLILEFLSWLENNRNSSIQTRNQRLAAWKSFCKFVQFENPEFFDICSSIRNIEPKKCKKKSINYLSVDAIKILLEQPNIKVNCELRDLAILSIAYDSAARVSEIIDLKVSNLNLDNTVTLAGKGNKIRIVPINKNVYKILKQYINIFNLDKDDLLFKNKYGHRITRQGITYIFNKYIQRAKVNYSYHFNIKVSPHCLRHSKAMHLLESGINLIYIRDFLGHESVITTEVYAKANPEIRRKEIEKNSESIINNSKFDKEHKNELLTYLREYL